MNPKLTELNKIYAAILDNAGLYIDPVNDGICFKIPAGRRAKLKDKFLMAPTAASLKSFDPERHVIFHPLREDVLQGKNETATFYQKILLLNMNLNISTLAQALLGLAASTSGQNNMNPEQIGFFQSIGNVDAKTVTNLGALITKEDGADLSKFFYTVYLKKNGKYKGSSMTCVGIADFPFYRSLAPGKLEGARINDVQVYKRLFEYMFPGIEDIFSPGCELFNHGVMGDCHTVGALVFTTAKIGQRVAELVEMFGEAFHNNALMTKEDIESAKYTIYLPEGYTEYGELGPISRSVPMQRNTALDEETPPAPAPVAAPVQRPATVQQPAPPPPAVVTAPQVHPMYQQPQQPMSPQGPQKPLSIATVVGPEMAYQQQMAAMQPGYGMMPPGYGMMPPQYQQPRNIHQIPLHPQRPPGYPGYPQPYQQPPMVDQYGRPIYPPQPQYPAPVPMVDNYGRPVNHLGQPIDQYGRPLQ